MIVAIDPGQSGAFAVKHAGKVEVHNMPETLGGTIELCKLLHAHGQDVAVYMEKINGFIGGAGPGQMFQFGKMCERPVAIWQTLGARIVEVRPYEWQSALHLGNCQHIKVEKNATPDTRLAAQQENSRLKRDWKNKLKDCAEKRYPGIRVTLKNADALLLLCYAVERENTIGAEWLG